MIYHLIYEVGDSLWQKRRIGLLMTMSKQLLEPQKTLPDR